MEGNSDCEITIIYIIVYHFVIIDDVIVYHFLGHLVWQVMW